jgi:hypothetical protein
VSDIAEGKWRGEITCSLQNGVSRNVLMLEIDHSESANTLRGWLVVHGRGDNRGMTTFEVIGTANPDGQLAITRQSEIGHNGVRFTDTETTMTGLLLTQNTLSLSTCYSTTVLHRVPKTTDLMIDKMPSPGNQQGS